MSDDDTDQSGDDDTNQSRDDEVDGEFENGDEFDAFDEAVETDGEQADDLEIASDAEPSRSDDHAAESTPSEEDPLTVFDEEDDELPDEDIFAQMETESVFDDEDVFDFLDEEEVAVETEADLLELQEVEAADEGAIIPKSQYCEKCEYFSAPPEMACENPGTEIHELTDLDHVRVTSCPIVTKRTQMASRDRD
ncbi:MAG: hypothetical protein U5K28_06665 [Halobacteriales archaeon]|nr:hypothetical protein [Halobacteriales archaeon]